MKMFKQVGFIAIAMLLFANDGFAAEKASKEKRKDKEETEKVVTAAASLYTGDATIVNHYLSDQEYKGPVVGAAVEFGAMYRRSQKVSWDLDLTYLGSSYSDVMDGNVSNPAGTSAYSMNRINADYGTYFNWNPVKNLSIKAGGSFDFLFGLMNGVPNHINNSLDFDFQTQFKAGIGVRYGWNIKNKVSIFLQANIETPFMGLALSSSKYESSADAIIKDEILPGSITPVCFTSFHNLNGFNADIEVELILRKTTIFYAMEWNQRCWYLHDVQNVRKFAMTRFGLKVDLVARNRVNSNNRFF